MGLFTRKREEEIKEEEFSYMTLPFSEKKEEAEEEIADEIEEATEETAEEIVEETEEAVVEETVEITETIKEIKEEIKEEKRETPKPESKPSERTKLAHNETIEMLLSEITPMEALRKRMQSAGETPLEEVKTEAKEEPLEEPKPSFESPMEPEVQEEPKVDEAYLEVIKSIENMVPKDAKPKKTAKSGSLLAKCLPFIYEENAVVEEEKPKYTLESVDTILAASEGNKEEKSLPKIKMPSSDSARAKQKRFRIGDRSFNSAEENRRLPDAAPTKATTLFDDFSGKHTMIAEDGSTVEIPVRLTKIQTDIPLVEDMTCVMPAIKPESNSSEIYEDIISHTKPINTKSLPIIKSAIKKKNVFSIENIKQEEITVDDYVTKSDAKRIGTRLKKIRKTAFLRLAATTVLTIIALIFATPLAEGVYTESPLAASIICLVVTALLLLVNSNVFESFKDGFSSRMDSRFPVALSGIAMLVFLILQIVLKHNDPEHSALFAVAVYFYDLCAYKKATAHFNGFKKVVKNKEKKAVALIDDQNTTAYMSRSAIEGEVLAAATRRTKEVNDYVKHISQDISFKGKLNIITIVTLSLSVILSVIVGMSYDSLSIGLCTFASLLSISAMPTLTLAEMMPFFKAAEKIGRMGGTLCSATSAERIEEINAVVLGSEEIFPDGTITLHSIKPLSANNIDETLIEAAAVAYVAKSPLFSVLRGMIGRSTELPMADTVQYEDTLGISGWVGDHHLHIGNRTLMESHGIRVPSLEVDKKILYRGYFPVYIASEQRACALLMIKYEPDDEICNQIISLQNSGVVLLVDNCDPNITEKMLCDYCGFYMDSVKIMDHHGTTKYKDAVNPTENYSAHAFYDNGTKTFLSILTGSFKLKKASEVLSVLHIILSVIALVAFAYLSLSGALTVISAATCLLIELAALIISFTGYLITGS